MSCETTHCERARQRGIRNAAEALGYAEQGRVDSRVAGSEGKSRDLSLLIGESVNCRSSVLGFRGDRETAKHGHASSGCRMLAGSNTILRGQDHVFDYAEYESRRSVWKVWVDRSRIRRVKRYFTE